MSQTYYSRPQDTQSDFQCRHIFTDGHRCGSPCLRHEELCYYHHTTRRPVEDPAARKARLGTFVFPGPSELSDRSGIQLAIAQVLERVASNDLDPRRAGLLLYGLQTAALNLPRPDPKAEAPLFVTEMTEDPTLGPLAPRATIEELRPVSEATRLLDELLQEGDYAPEDTILPSVQAVAGWPEHSVPTTKAGCPMSLALGDMGSQDAALSPLLPLPFARPSYPLSLIPRSASCTTSSPNPPSHRISVSRRNHVNCRLA